MANQKGGVGKTTTAINLSSCLSAAGKRVILIDIDPQGNATSGLGQTGKGKASIYDVLIGDAAPMDAVLHTEYDGLDLLPSTISLAGAEIELVGIENRETLLKNALDALRPHYDYLLMDCPPSLGLLTLNALTAADSVLVPIQCEYYALEGVGQLMNTLNLIQNRLNPDLEIEGVVLTMLDGRTNLGIQVVQEVKKHFKNRVFASVIPRNVRLSEAPSVGQPIHIYDPKCQGALAYKELAAELIDRDEGEDW